MKMDFQDRIDDYLLNRMSDEERKNFEAEAAEDAELKEQLIFTENVRQAIISRNEKLAAMEKWKKDYAWEDERATDFRRILYWASGIAAVFVVAFFLTWHYYEADRPSKYKPSQMDSDVTLRDSSDSLEIELLLDQKKYEEALELIEEKFSTIKEDSLEMVQDETIETERKAYVMQIILDKQDELKWQKVQALIGLGQKENALRILDELRHKENCYQFAADTLYNQIKE